MSSVTRQAPPDQAQRERALDPRRSILVQAPAGSGKTDLLTRRFLRLLTEVDDPGQIVAITFTRAAAAEMRHRILAELEKASSKPGTDRADEFAMSTLARRAWVRSQARGWNLVNLPAQLRISTIDSFCREIALQEPLLSSLGGGLDISENPAALYHRAARRTLEQIAEGTSGAPSLAPEIERLLLWRDNGWHEMEDLLVQMLGRRDAWMQDFWLSEFRSGREPDWDALREQLEKPFARAVSECLGRIDQLLDQETRDEAMDLARFACGQKNNWLQCKLFHFTGQPCQPFVQPDALEQARQGYCCLAEMLLTDKGNLRRSVNVRDGFPVDRRDEKARVYDLLDRLNAIPAFEATLDSVRKLPPARYSEEDWAIVRSCFRMLRHAAGELRVAFAESGAVDFVEIAQMAQRVLKSADGFPADSALNFADGIRHLLVDEFQDTSRRQHQLITSLVALWPDPEQRSVFVVGDPMQSIYFFRDADAELFARVRTLGLELPDGDALALDPLRLSSNFRTDPRLVKTLNGAFARIFPRNDPSGVEFEEAMPARPAAPDHEPRYHLHVDFIPQTLRTQAADPAALAHKQAVTDERQAAHDQQIQQMVALIRGHWEQAQWAALRGDKYRIAVLGRARTALDPVARALREAQIPFRAVELEKLADRPEVLDALSLARALLQPEDRVAWLGVLRAPWCGLTLADLHTLTSNDDPALLRRPVPALLAERSTRLSDQGQHALDRLLRACHTATERRAAHPYASIGTLLEQTWLQLGGADCVDAAARANLDLLFSCLDRLPAGEPDLLGGLDVALESLTALPDPAADSDNGVHLMTIHKSKGLEFEIVIVPELQALGTQNGIQLLSWLERGLTAPEDSGEITEFLVAPISAKGEESSPTRAWVNAVRHERETQETRRILYVAATRAREELHLFTRAEYRTERDGTLSLCNPSRNLLATGWPALEEEIRARFNEWNRGAAGTLHTIAAGEESNLLLMPRPARPALLHQLPPDYIAPQPSLIAPAATESITGFAAQPLYERHEGGERSRALGIAVHLLLEQLARLRTANDWPAACAALGTFLPRVKSMLRAAGIPQEQAAVLSTEALEIARQASQDPNAQWLLSAHPDAASEVRWAGVLDGRVHEVRVDRVFRAGLAPHAEGDTCWWVIDYKTAVAPQSEAGCPNSETLAALRSRFAAQLERYADVLRNLHGNEIPIHAALYYPRMLILDWWQL